MKGLCSYHKTGEARRAEESHHYPASISARKKARKMKDAIMKLLDENKDELKDISASEKKASRRNK